MKPATQNKVEIIRPEIPDTIIKVPYNQNSIRFVYPAKGPDTYTNVFNQILGKNLRPAKGGETASLLYEVYCNPEINKEPESVGIKNIARNRWIWVATR